MLNKYLDPYIKIISNVITRLEQLVILPLAALITHELIGERISPSSSSRFRKNQFGIPLQLRNRCGIVMVLVSTCVNC